MGKIKYGEIYFLGNCICKCFYCIGKETRTERDNNAYMNVHYEHFKNIHKFLDMLKDKGTNVVYLSSTCTDPLIYRYVAELIEMLHKEGFKVGIRSNAYLFMQRTNVIELLDEEISLSVQALTSKNCYKICGIEEVVPWKDVLIWLKDHNKKCRLTMVVNQYNQYEAEALIDLAKDFNDVVSYIQFRKIFYENYDVCLTDSLAYDNIKSMLEEKYEKKVINGFTDYDCDGVLVSTWDKPLEKDTIDSLNYFVNGQITTACHIVKGKEGHEEEVAN